MKVFLRLWIVLLALALVASACGDDGGEPAASGESSTPDPEPTDDDPIDEPMDDDPVDEPVDEPEPLDVGTGVTETSIKVGVAVPDFDALQAAGIGNYQGDADVAFQVFFDQINAAGGILGRQIEPVYVGFDFIRPETQDVACEEFVGDHEVFIVLYGLLGDSNLCLTELSDTMVMTRSFQTSTLQERSGETLWLQLNAVDEAKTAIMARTLAGDGRLDGKTIGIITGEDSVAEGELLQDVLDDLGFGGSSLRVTTESQADQVAYRNEAELIGEAWKTDGVDFVFELQGGGNLPTFWAEIGFEPQTAHKNLGATVDAQPDRSVMAGAVGVGEINEQAIFDDADFSTNCMDPVREAHPELAEELSFLPSGDQQATGQPNWINPVMIACDQTRLFVALAVIAGAELNNTTFKAALDELGPFDLYGYGQGSFRSDDKWDGLDEFYIQEYDATTDSIQVVSDPIVVSR